MPPKPAPYSRKVGSQAEEPSIIESNDCLIVGGYQKFILSKNDILYAHPQHRLKYLLVRPYLIDHYSQERIVDIGCSAGVIGLQALLDGCSKVSFVDHDPDYIKTVNKSLSYLSIDTSTTHVSALSSFNISFDVGFAFALIHWIYSYSELSGSLDDAIGLLKRIAQRAIFIEWVEPDDYAILQASHIFQNRERHTGPYNREEFISALKKHYGFTKFIGNVTASRELWLACTEPEPLVVTTKRSTARIILCKWQLILEKHPRLRKLHNRFRRRLRKLTKWR